MKLPHNWNADSVYVLRFYKNVLGILGLWVLDEGNIHSKIRWCVSTMVEMSATISLSLEVIRHCHGHGDTLDAFLSGATSLISLSKLLLHRVTWRHKLILVESIIHDWSFVKNTYSRNIMLKYARRGRFVSLLFFYLGCASCVYLVSAFVLFDNNLSWILKKQVYNKTNEKKLLLATYCVFGKYTSFTYGCIEALQLMQILVNWLSQCGNDGFFFCLSMHVCGQFEILRTDLAAMKSGELDVLLKRHHHLIYLSQNLEKAFSPVILAQLFMTVVLLCVEGFQLILSLTIHDTFSASKHMLFIIVLLLQIFLYCFAGQTLEFQSQGLAYAAYEAPWYNFNVTAMKDLRLIILRTVNPHRLTAGKFLAINFMSFREILKASASYLSVLRVMLDT